LLVGQIFTIFDYTGCPKVTGPVTSRQLMESNPIQYYPGHHGEKRS
jgi:hypothetical protein